MGVRPTRTSIPPVGEVWNIPRIQRLALHYITAKSDICTFAEAPVKNQSQKL